MVDRRLSPNLSTPSRALANNKNKLASSHSTSARVLAAKKLFGIAVFGFISFVLAAQPLIGISIWQFDRARAQESDIVDTGISPEDYGGGNPIDSLAELEPILLEKAPLKLAPQDYDDIRDYRVDVRVTDYLIYLVTPVDQGGAGFTHLKAQRILKNYDTTGTGRFDRESLAAIEEGGSVVSAHNSGQAVDISEIGAITCKMVERRHLGGSKTNWQSPKPIKVAWQSRDGISRHPTPKGASFIELAGGMSAQSILAMLNDSGELDELSDYVKGLSLPEILQYVGANVLLKNYGVGSIKSDPRANNLPIVLGALLLNKYVPGLPEGLPIAQTDEDIRVVIAKAQIEEMMNLPPGTLRGKGWQKVLESAGKRVIENALGIPALTLDKKKLEDVLKSKEAQAALKQYQKSDSAFSVLPGTIELIQAKDNKGLVYAGVNLIADALRLNQTNRDRLIAAAKNTTEPVIDLNTVGTDRNVPTNLLEAIFANKEYNDRLRSYGQEFLRDIVGKVVPNGVLGIDQKLIRDLINSSSSVLYEDIVKQIGLNKIASDSSINVRDSGNIEKNNSRLLSLIAGTLNNQFSLTGSSSISNQDVSSLITGNSDEALSKIGGIQADKAIGWNYGTGYQVITKKKTLLEGLEEVFGNSLAEIVGLPRDVSVSLKGNIYQNYGDELASKRLGIDIKGSGGASGIDQTKLYRAFGITDSRSLSALQGDSRFWFKPEVVNALKNTDIRLGAPLGTSEQYLRGSLTNDAFSEKIGKSNVSSITQDKLIDYLDLDDSLKLKKDELKLLISTLSNWDNSELSTREKALNLGLKLISRSLDQRATFSKDSFLNIIQGDPDKIVQTLIGQGVRMLAGALGANLKDFDEKELNNLTSLLTGAYNNQQYEGLFFGQLSSLLTEAMGIPKEFKADALALATGDTRRGLEAWSAAQMVTFANKILPGESQLSYLEIRNSFDFANYELIQARTNEIIAQSGKTSQTEEEYLVTFSQARRELMQEARDSSKYKISDAFLLQANIPIPKDFSRIMFTGTTKERAEIMVDGVFAYVDNILINEIPGYSRGSLKNIYDKKPTEFDIDSLIISIANRGNVEIGGMSASFMVDFFRFVQASNKDTFFTDPRRAGMWNYLENFLGDKFGIAGLPTGFAKSIYLASQNNWSFNSTLKDSRGNVVVNSLSGIGRELLANRLTLWADKTLSLPPGAAYQIYQAAKGVDTASRALAAARAGGDAAKITSAGKSLTQAQAHLVSVAISVALNSCAACQQFFASVDRALAAPPGFTNTLVAGAISMALGLGPGGLIAAAAIYLFGVYRVDYLCPLPPPDIYALPQFDNDYDQVESSNNSYYSDPTKKIKDNPAPGENPFDWDDGVPFKDGNNPELWMAWSRYFTGKLLNATMDYGAAQPDFGKPLQVITYRQANVEFFGPRSVETFGIRERNNPNVGLGFSQKSTKTTDWVHASFGGIL